MFPRRTNNGEGSSRGGDHHHPRRRPRRIIVITEEEVHGPPPGFDRNHRMLPPPPHPLPLPPPIPRNIHNPPQLPRPPLPPVAPIRRDLPRVERILGHAREMLGRRNNNFLNRIEREMAMDRLEARQAEREAQRARQGRLQEEALRQRREEERRLREREAVRRLGEHLEEVAGRVVRDRQLDEAVPARETPVEERPRPAPVRDNRAPAPAPGLQVPAPVPAAPVVTLPPTRQFPPSQVLTTSCHPSPHHFCRDCLRSFFSNAMQANVWRNGDTFPPTCCGNRFYIHADDLDLDSERGSREEVRARNLRFHRLLGVEMFREYMARVEQECGWLVPDRFMGVEGRRDSEVVCHHCRQVTCVVCEGRAHRGRYRERCPGPRRTTEEQRRLEERAEEQFRELRRRELWQTCPTCEATVERNGGCNLIHCIRCLTYFCYHCRTVYPNGHWDAGLCPCPTFGPGDAERRMQDRREAGIPDHVPEGEEDDFLQGRDHQGQLEDGHHGGHHHDDWHPRGHNDHERDDRHRLRHPHDDWDQHVRHFDEHDLHDHDFFHGGDHRDILDHIPERLLNLPIEVDSDHEGFPDDRFVLDGLVRRYGGHGGH
ncbi:hypothetical protein B0T20DRAFT_455738 [Sordaria brevicollis]|uniref:RING-type domain-containing protein n=1 Tax=Sordaria brevicollis TaxID=83679 RepID=A0AAE0P9T0_SORBR|nr:hypothetical protein B0T20DRAFT_455738 [Sordaria brevicollis]